MGASKLVRCELEDEGSLSSSYGVESTLLKPPGQFETWEQGTKRYVQLPVHKGMKFDIAKPLTPNFMLRHGVTLGESNYSPTATEDYSLQAQVFNETGVIVGTVHPMNGTLF